MKSSSIFIKKRGEQIWGFKVYKNTRIISFLFCFVFFTFEAAFADNYGRPVVSHLTTARQIP